MSVDKDPSIGEFPDFSFENLSTMERTVAGMRETYTNRQAVEVKYRSKNGKRLIVAPYMTEDGPAAWQSGVEGESDVLMVSSADLQDLSGHGTAAILSVLRRDDAFGDLDDAVEGVRAAKAAIEALCEKHIEHIYEVARPALAMAEERRAKLKELGSGDTVRRLTYRRKEDDDGENH